MMVVDTLEFCAGAVLAVPKSPSLELMQHIKTVNDNIWWDSGIYGDAKLKSTDSGSMSHRFNIEFVCV